MPVPPSDVRPSRRRIPAALAVLAAAALAVAGTAGCGGDKSSNPIVTPPVWQGPANSTPAGALARFEASYEQKRLAEYVALFAADFQFRFSSSSDPDLASQYGTSWGTDDESASTQHLFAGFTSTHPPFETYGPATAIVLSLPGAIIIGDPDHADSTDHYKLAVVPSVDLMITVLNGDIETIYEVVSPHDFHLVRGDAAFLGATQAADSLHWYIRRWADKSPASSARTLFPGRISRGVGLDRVMPVESLSWGGIKNVYR